MGEWFDIISVCIRSQNMVRVAIPVVATLIFVRLPLYIIIIFDSPLLLKICSNSDDKSSEFVNTFPVSIHHLKTKFIYDEPILRGLLAESNSIFQELQQQTKIAGARPDCLHISQTYRSIIRSCLQKLQKCVEHEANRVYDDYITIFYSIECLWHLCEIFLIDSAPSSAAVPHLNDWIRFHFPEVELRARELLLFANQEESDKEYLRIAKLLVVQGHLDVARTILQYYGCNHFNACLQMTEEILKSIPIYSASGGLSLQSWRSQWQYWVADTESKLEMGCFDSESDRELKEIVELVTGNERAWYDLSKESTCWYEYFPGYLFYTQQNCTYYQLGSIAEKWLHHWLSARGETEPIKHLDRVILNIMQHDLHQVLRDIQHMCDQQWFATHFTDLLWHCGKLNVLSEEANEYVLQ